MSLSGDYLNEMQRLELDLDTADRLLAGSVLPEDAPPGYEGVAALLTQLERHAEAPVPAEELVAVLAETVRSAPCSRKPSLGRSSSVPRLRFAVAVAVAVAALVGTAGLAVAGVLPGAAQDIASDMLAKVGVTVPGPNSNAGNHPNTRGNSSVPAAEPSGSPDKGAEISGLATSGLSGLEKGAAVSTAASEGKSKAGQEHPNAAEHSQATETPSAGGTSIADTASGGRSSKGTSQANEASGGRSAAGSGNAAEGRAHKP